MSKPTVKVKDKQYAVSQISVILKLNSCPLIHLRLSEKLDGKETKISNEDTFKQEFFQDICAEAEGSFAWGGTLKFFLVGYNSPEARTFELVGLVVKKDLIDWFNQNNFKEKKEDYLIYQKGKGKNSWSFFNMVLEDKFKQPNQDFINKTDLLFPDNGCIWRYKESNNFHFLNRAIAFASRHLPQVQGWCGFDDSKPLRLIVFEEEKQNQTIPKLDNTWAASSYPFVPNRYSWNRWLDKSSTLTRELSIQNGQEMALIKELTSHGLNDEDGKSYQSQNPTQLLFSPGTITIGEKNIFCHTITYEFKLPAFGEESSSVTMKIEVDYPERQIGDNEIISLRLPGKFKEWHKQKDGETEIKIVASDLKNWGLVDEGSQSLKSGNDAVLSTHILSPTYSDDDYSGIYVKHEKDDEMIVDIHPCSIPLVLGSVQKYRKELEEADVTLSGEKLAISVSNHYQSLDKSEAIILDNSEIKLNHGKKIFGQAQQQVDFLSQNVEIGSSQVKINSGKTNINSLVNISFPLITIDNQIFEKRFASGTNNLCLLDTLAQLTNKYTEGSPNDLKDIFKTFLADDTQLIEVGPQQDFMDGNISENLLLALSHENKENFEIQVYDQNPDGSITKYDKFTAKDKLTGEDQYPGKKPIVLNMLREKTGDGQYHFSPLFPKEQGNVDNNESKNRQLPAELVGGGVGVEATTSSEPITGKRATPLKAADSEAVPNAFEKNLLSSLSHIKSRDELHQILKTYRVNEEDYPEYEKRLNKFWNQLDRDPKDYNSVPQIIQSMMDPRKGEDYKKKMINIVNKENNDKAPEVKPDSGTKLYRGDKRSKDTIIKDNGFHGWGGSMSLEHARKWGKEWDEKPQPQKDDWLQKWKSQTVSPKEELPYVAVGKDSQKGGNQYTLEVPKKIQCHTGRNARLVFDGDSLEKSNVIAITGRDEVVFLTGVPSKYIR